MRIRLPSRYEDIDETYRGRLIPNQNLLKLVSEANKSMQISGGIRFLPLYGESGAGKSCVAREISTHLPGTKTIVLAKEEIESNDHLIARLTEERRHSKGKLLIAIIDQYEETVSGKEMIPTQFVEYLSLLDRGELRSSEILFIWLSTNLEFCGRLAQATTRNRRILLREQYTISGPPKSAWASIIEETFSFHNAEKALADYGVISTVIEKIADDSATIGEAIEKIGTKLGEGMEGLQNLSEYQVVIMWPVADSIRNQRVLQFSKPRDGYKLNWDIWFNELNEDDRKQLPIEELNRARLYFDVRVVPFRAADLFKLCGSLVEKENLKIAPTYLKRFQDTHFFHVISDDWDTYDYNPVRERQSKRASEAEAWYKTVTDKPTYIGRRIASVLRQCGVDAVHEKSITSEYASVRADVFIDRHYTCLEKSKVIVELKVFSSENTMPSSIKDAIKTTLKRHAQLAGFLQRQ